MATWPKTLSDAESQTLAERRYAVQNAVGTLAIEGLEMEPAEMAILERFASGLIDMEQARAAMLSLPLKK